MDCDSERPRSSGHLGCSTAGGLAHRAELADDEWGSLGHAPTLGGVPANDRGRSVRPLPVVSLAEPVVARHGREEQAMSRSLVRVSILPFALVVASTLAAQRSDEMTFQHVGAIAPGNAAYLLGNLDELGGGQLVRSIRMTPRPSNNWEIVVRLPANRSFQYWIYERSATNPNLLAQPTHGILRAGPLQGTTPARAIVPTSKRLAGYVALPGAVLNWRQDQGAFQTTPLLQRAGGRTSGEWLYEAPSFGAGQLPVEFFFTDATGALRVPATGSMSTPLDAFFVQDGHVFTYWPAPLVHPHRRDYTSANPPTLFSTTLNQSRAYRVILPRGYDDQPWRRYPVCYFHDGPWMFDPGTLVLYFTDAIDPNGDTTAGLVQRGEVGECILVGVDWGTTVAQQVEIARVRDYLPPGSSYDYNNGLGPIAVAADRSATFLIQELKPLIDATYRTRPDRATTFVAGFSFGGVASAYLGWDHDSVFGRIGLFSPSLWVQSFPNRLLVEPLRFDLRIYMDSGFDNYSWTAN